MGEKQAERVHCSNLSLPLSVPTSVSVSPSSSPCNPCCDQCSDRRKRLFTQDPVTCRCSCKHTDEHCKERQLELNERTCKWVSTCTRTCATTQPRRPRAGPRPSYAAFKRFKKWVTSANRNHVLHLYKIYTWDLLLKFTAILELK